MTWFWGLLRFGEVRAERFAILIIKFCFLSLCRKRHDSFPEPSRRVWRSFILSFLSVPSHPSTSHARGLLIRARKCERMFFASETATAVSITFPIVGMWPSCTPTSEQRPNEKVSSGSVLSSTLRSDMKSSPLNAKNAVSLSQTSQCCTGFATWHASIRRQL